MLKLKKKRGAKNITLRWLVYLSTYTIVIHGTNMMKQKYAVKAHNSFLSCILLNLNQRFVRFFHRMTNLSENVNNGKKKHVTESKKKYEK